MPVPASASMPSTKSKKKKTQKGSKYFEKSIKNVQCTHFYFRVIQQNKNIVWSKTGFA